MPAQGPRASIVRLLVLSVLAGSLAFAATPAPARAAAMYLHAFKVGLGCTESTGNYWARNTSSGAYGKYQIMPSNWPAWAQQYLGDRNAPQTPINQERVARGKLMGLHHWLHTYRNTAHWWLTGSSDTDESHWSDYSKAYVDKVMGYARKAMTEAGRQSLPDRCLSTPSNPNP
jgi:hypothetical protein